VEVPFGPEAPDDINEPKFEDAATHTDTHHKFRASNLQNDDKMLHFYTGLANFQLFLLVFNSLRM